MLRRSKILVRQLSQRRQFQIETRKPLPLQLSSTVPLPPPKELLIPPDHNDLFVTNVMVNRNVNRCYGIKYLIWGALRKCLLRPDEYVERTNLSISKQTDFSTMNGIDIELEEKYPFCPSAKSTWTHVLCFTPTILVSRRFERMHVSSGYRHLTSSLTSSLPPPLEINRNREIKRIIPVLSLPVTS